MTENIVPSEKKTDEFQNFSNYDFSNFYFGAGNDIMDSIVTFNKWWEKAYPGLYHIYQEQLTSAPDTTISMQTNSGALQKDLLNLSSYNYLGMANAPVVKKAAIAALEKYGLGASGGPILSGMFEIHRQLEAALALFKQKEACLTFNSGYAANLGIISGIMRSGDTILMDQYAHASLIDGAILSKAKIIFFRHNNTPDLEKKASVVTGKKLIIVEGIYSMDGDICNLPDIVQVAKKFNCRILIDEAHSSFVCGEHGRGVVELFGLEKEVDFHMGTFSKALGGIGGYACGSHSFINYLTAYARSRFFSCTLPPAVSAGVLASLQYIDQHPELRQRLWHNVHYLQKRFREEGVNIGNAAAQVMPVMLFNDAKAFIVATKLRAKGIFLQPVTSPAVSKGKARLRLSVCATHTIEQLEMAVQAITTVLNEEDLLWK